MADILHTFSNAFSSMKICIYIHSNLNLGVQLTIHDIDLDNGFAPKQVTSHYLHHR